MPEPTLDQLIRQKAKLKVELSDLAAEASELRARRERVERELGEASARIRDAVAVAVLDRMGELVNGQR